MGRNLIGKGQVTEQNVATLVLGMKRAYPDAVRNLPIELIEAMTNEHGDRHVLATAVHAGSEVIVTQNGRHFPSDSLSPYGIEVPTLDEFLLNLLSLDSSAMVRVVRYLLEHYNKPPYSDAVALLASFGGLGHDGGDQEDRREQGGDNPGHSVLHCVSAASHGGSTLRCAVHGCLRIRCR